jgi:MtaA/CmuA family methyltransferase
MDFLEGRSVDRPPFHPILMRFAAKYCGVNYRDFCLNPTDKCSVNLRCAKDFSYDWVNVMSDPWAEASSFGTKVGYPVNSLPTVDEWLIHEIKDINKIRPLRVNNHPRLVSRLEEIKYFRQHAGDSQFICGWVEGPLAEYCDLRNVTEAFIDFFEHPEELKKALELITDSTMSFLEAQIRAGAHCIGIGDAVCSLISPDLYLQFVFPLEKALVDHAHSLGAKVKLHICGNTTAILPDMIRTGADLIDIDHLVEDIEFVIPLLSGHQAVSGNSDPVSVVQNGTVDQLAESVESCFIRTCGRGVISAGCEITPETTIEQMMSYSMIALGLKWGKIIKQIKYL